MKTRNTILVFLLASLLFTISCSKDNKCKDDDCHDDYRANYIGDWDFVVERINYTGWTTEHDTVYYSGIITYGNNDTTLSITYYINTILPNVPIDKFGKLDNFFNRPSIQGQFEGYKKVYLEYKDHNPAGLGSTHIISGRKQI
jgi:hypothetical protein